MAKRARDAIIEYNKVIGAMETMRAGFLEFTTGLINLELFKIDAPKALKKMII